MRLITEQKHIPIFFAVDDRYVPYLTVALRSICENSSKDHKYDINILIDELSEQCRENIRAVCREDFTVRFINVREKLERMNGKLHLRDYYSKATYYRFFIPEMFPQYDKGIYLDCDIAVTCDISELFGQRLGRSLVAAVTDEVVTDIPVFSEYSERVLGIERQKYFNAGILLMNLKEMRRIDIESRFLSLMQKHTFRVAQDQDYLNVLCYDRVRYLDGGWNKTPFPYSDKNVIPHIAHYKLNFKPWHYSGVMYEEIFWDYAAQTPYYDELISQRENYSEESKSVDQGQYDSLKRLAAQEICEAGQTEYIPPVSSVFLCGVV